MPMQAQSLEILEKANVPPATARAFVQAIEIELAAAKDTLSTKHDLLELRHDLISRIERSHSDLKIDIAGSKADLETKIVGTKAELVRWVFLVMLGNVALSAGATALLNALQRVH